MSTNNTSGNKIFGKSGKYERWRIISILVVGLMLASALFAANFVYKNIYITLSNANTIIVLSSNLGVDAVDTKNYNLAEEKKAAKNNAFSWPKETRKIFDYAITVTTTTTTTR